MAAESVPRALERYLGALKAQDWKLLASAVADDLERTGPFLDVVRGRQAYVEFLSGIIPTLRNYELKIFRTRRLADGSALVELSETVDLDGVRTESPELLLFEFNPQGLISRIDIYIKRPPAGGVR
jgi:hypothetical protein